MTISGDLR